MSEKSAAELRLPATDPVCGMRIETVAVAAERRVHANQTYVFCSADCAMKFDNDREAYIAAMRVLGERYGRATSAAEEEELLRRTLEDGAKNR